LSGGIAQTLVNLSTITTALAGKIDNTGDTMTGALTMSASSITVTSPLGIGAPQFYAGTNVYVSSATAAQGGGVYVSTTMYVTGSSSFTATGMNTYSVIASSGISVGGPLQVNGTVNLGPNAYLDNGTAAQGGGVYVSTTMYVTGASSFTASGMNTYSIVTSSGIDIGGPLSLGAGGTSFSSMGVCVTSNTVVSVSSGTFTCTGLPASTSLAISCSGSSAFTKLTSIYCRATGTVNSMMCNTSLANTVQMIYACLWIKP
jgi:hypothetical protein